MTDVTEPEQAPEGLQAERERIAVILAQYDDMALNLSEALYDTLMDLLET